MSEAGIAVTRARQSPRYRACATCRSDVGVRKPERYTGFCHECIDRSRIVDADDLGGEA